MSDLSEGVAPLPHLGVIRVEGEDAASFLHNQLTQDFSLLGLNEARLAAYCSAKGRMLASFIGFKRSQHEILLVCERDVLPAMLKRLSMFVLRAKAKLSDASADWVLQGITEPASLAFNFHDASLQVPFRLKANGETDYVITLPPADGKHRVLKIASSNNALPASMPTERWQWSDVRSGVVLVSQAVSEAFVPQMLNYESVGGVNFKKGCYPGQEVVARSQFRGVLKRRGYLLHSEQPLKAGDELFDALDPSQPCGLVAQAAASPTGGFDAFASLQTNSAEAGQLRLGAQGPAVQLLPLPYALRDDI